MEIRTYINFIKPEMTEGNTGFEHQLFFHTTYVNSLTSEYKHMTILFSKENDTNEWMILFLLKTNIDFTQFKKIKYKNLYLIQINKTNSKTQFAHFIYNTTIPWHSKINRKMIQLAQTVGNEPMQSTKILRIISNFYNQSNYALLEHWNNVTHTIEWNSVVPKNSIQSKTNKNII